MVINWTCSEFVTPKALTTIKMLRLCSCSMACWLIVTIGLCLERNRLLFSLQKLAMMLGLVIIEEPDIVEVTSNMTPRNQLMASIISTIASTSLVSTMHQPRLTTLEIKLIRLRFHTWVIPRERVRCLWLWLKITDRWMIKSTYLLQWHPLSTLRIQLMHFLETWLDNGIIWFHLQTYLIFMRLMLEWSRGRGSAVDSQLCAWISINGSKLMDLMMILQLMSFITLKYIAHAL